MSESAAPPSASSSSQQQPQALENYNNKGIIDTEESLRNQLRNSMQAIKRREPLDFKYKKLLLGGIVTNRKPILSKDKFYKRIQSNLRNRVERFMEQTSGKDPFDNILSRQPLIDDEEKMRAALTLREHKKHEQKALLDATIASLPRYRNGMDAMSRKRELDCIALGLQQVEVIRLTNHNNKPDNAAMVVGSSTSMNAKEELDQRKIQAKAREEARKRRDDEMKQKVVNDEVKKRKKTLDTPQQALHKLYQPIFQKLWDMEFTELGNINPFRLVIDKDSCTSLGAPDYFDIIDIPMNLTYIQNKVNNMEYISLRSFFNDIDLMINNALKYNTNIDNPYHIAAEEMKLFYKKIAQRVIKTLQQKKKQKQELQAQLQQAQQQAQQQK